MSTLKPSESVVYARILSVIVVRELLVVQGVNDHIIALFEGIDEVKQERRIIQLQRKPFKGQTDGRMVP